MLKMKYEIIIELNEFKSPIRFEMFRFLTIPFATHRTRPNTFFPISPEEERDLWEPFPDLTQSEISGKISFIFVQKFSSFIDAQ